jgi:hypothetical protein
MLVSKNYRKEGTKMHFLIAMVTPSMFKMNFTKLLLPTPNTFPLAQSSLKQAAPSMDIKT